MSSNVIITSMFGLYRNSNTDMAASDPEPKWSNDLNTTNLSPQTPGFEILVVHSLN